MTFMLTAVSMNVMERMWIPAGRGPRERRESPPMGYTFPDHWRDYRAVLSHDWLTGMRGGERCLELLCEGIPDAQVFTLVHDPERISETINRHPVHTSFLQRLPLFRARFRNLLPFFPRAIEGFTLPEADLVISTSHCVAKGIRPPEGARHVCYCFTPIRYGIFFDDYFGQRPVQRYGLVRQLDSQ